VGCAVSTISADELKAAIRFANLTHELADPLEHLLSTNGKQVRPGLLIACAQAGRRRDDPEVRSAAIAIELFQLATLAHDDVVDNGEVRRGSQTVANSYGNGASGFVGGILFAHALELMAALGAEPASRFAIMASEVCHGQMREGEDLFDVERSFDRYYAAISGKTASLFDLSAWLGAWLAGADSVTAATYARFGREFGHVFQVADDILDLIASEAETGKSPAKDLCQGVYNLPVLHALASDGGLRSLLGRDNIDQETDAVVTRIRTSGGIKQAISDCCERADAAATLLRAGVELRPICVEAPIALLYQAVDPVIRLSVGQADAA
jgi:heptaprenyl diphosphate synthase